jgi:hypothetical protein
VKEGIPNRPVGDAPKWFFMRRVWDYVFGGQFPIKAAEGLGLKIEWVDSTYLITKTPERRSPPQSSSTSDWYLGEWNDTLSVSAQQVVSYTPDGGFEGTYVCILDAPVGTLPSDGAPYYKPLVAPPAGAWAV